jgi:hypothetical protein
LYFASPRADNPESGLGLFWAVNPATLPDIPFNGSFRRFRRTFFPLKDEVGSSVGGRNVRQPPTISRKAVELLIQIFGCAEWDDFIFEHAEKL